MIKDLRDLRFRRHHSCRDEGLEECGEQQVSSLLITVIEITDLLIEMPHNLCRSMNSAIKKKHTHEARDVIVIPFFPNHRDV